MTRRKKSRTKAQSAPSGQVDIRQARTQLSRLIERVAGGEEIIIARAGRPVARLLPFEPTQPRPVFGADRGAFVVPEDFDAPLPEEILTDFER